jgi:hypothetical protein
MAERPDAGQVTDTGDGTRGPFGQLIGEQPIIHHPGKLIDRQTDYPSAGSLTWGDTFTM